MSDLDATDINNLPVNPSLGTANALPPNIVMSKNEKIPEGALERLTKERENDLKIPSGPATQALSVNNQMPSALEQTTLNSLISDVMFSAFLDKNVILQKLGEIKKSLEEGK